MAFAALAIIAMVLAFLISAIPLNIAARLLGGKSSIIWAAITNLIAGLVSAAIYSLFSRIGSIAAFISLLAVYKFMFRLGWIRALLVWLLQGIIALLLVMLFIFLITLIV